jgi:hypothetical protein
LASLLKEEQQIFIVQLLACYKSPTEVTEAVKEEFDIEVTRQLVRTYNPKQNPEIAEKWKDLFDETRKRFLTDTSEIGIAQQSYRLQALHELLLQAGLNRALKLQILEQAAKETGGNYTNKREITGADGKDFVPVLNLTLEIEKPRSTTSAETDEGVSEQGD